MTCVNHPDVPATHVAEMPSSTKQPDGSYTGAFPLCQPCAVRVKEIGFPVSVLA